MTMALRETETNQKAELNQLCHLVIFSPSLPNLIWSKIYRNLNLPF